MDENTLEIAWVAGFWQGDGWCGFDKAERVMLTPYLFPVVRITQYYDKESLERVCAAMGFGAVHGPYEKERGDREVYQYYAGGGDAVLFMERIAPLLSGKKAEQAEEFFREYGEFKSQNRDYRLPQTLVCPNGHERKETAQYNSAGFLICRSCHADAKRRLRSKRKNSPTRICDVEGCELAHAARGLCDKHYRRLKKHGDESVVLNTNGVPKKGKVMP